MCEALPDDCCVERADCMAIVADYVDDDCVRENIAGCREAADMCAQAITYGIGPNKNCWRFSDACVPVAWDVAACDSTAFEGLPRCPSSP